MRGPPGRHQQDLGWMVQRCRTGRDGRAAISLGAIFVSWDCVCVLLERKIMVGGVWLVNDKYQFLLKHIVSCKKGLLWTTSFIYISGKPLTISSM